MIPTYYNKELNDFELNINAYEEMLEKDVEDGLVPFWVGINLGCTSTSGVEPIA